jgi:hypothetical protein
MSKYLRRFALFDRNQVLRTLTGVTIVRHGERKVKDYRETERFLVTQRAFEMAWGLVIKE